MAVGRHSEAEAAVVVALGIGERHFGIVVMCVLEFRISVTRLKSSRTALEEKVGIPCVVVVIVKTCDNDVLFGVMWFSVMRERGREGVDF